MVDDFSFLRLQMLSTFGNFKCFVRTPLWSSVTMWQGRTGDTLKLNVHHHQQVAGKFQPSLKYSESHLYLEIWTPVGTSRNKQCPQLYEKKSTKDELTFEVNYTLKTDPFKLGFKTLYTRFNGKLTWVSNSSDDCYSEITRDSPKIYKNRKRKIFCHALKIHQI